MKFLILLCFIESFLVCESILFFDFVNDTLKHLFRRFSNSKSQEVNPDFDLENFYDFIVVGSGSSGAVIASRLSEVLSWKVLLLEAGNSGNFITQIPIMAPILQHTPYNWNYTMERQEGFCEAMYDGICSWPRGKALGGTTVLNYMIYTRGNQKDYDKWASLGNEGWSYADVLPYFLKSENCRLGAECDSNFHNNKGPLSTEYPFKSRILDAFLQAGVEMGEKIVDYNGEEYMGFSQIQANQKFGRRHSTADAFLYPYLKNRRNLHVMTSVRVTKILIDSVTKQALGVVFKKRGKDYTVNVLKEVVLSAGVFNSPQILMLSGIGPKEHLTEMNIPIVQPLPVGQVLYDHIAYLGMAFKINETIEPKTAIFDPLEPIKWLLNGKGIYTSLAGVEGLAYINTGSIPDSKYPDVELIFIGAGSLESDLGLVVAREIRLKREIYNKVFKPLEPYPAWSIMPMLLHPKSRGYLKLRSRDPYDAPKMYGNFFTDPEATDIETLLAAIRYIQKLSKTAAFQKYGSTIHDIPLSGCETHVFDSDDYWKCCLRSLSSTLHHQIGTCKMGPSSDAEAVVDSRLRVYGIKNLRVADSSVVPVTLSAHLSAPSIMIGEKAADIIKEDWGIRN